MTRSALAWIALGVAAALAQAEPIHAPKSATPAGITLHKLNLAHGRLTSPPLDNLEFVLSDVDFALTRRFTQYSGDVSGRMLGALGLIDHVLAGKSALTRALVDALPSKQQPDGHFGAPQDLAAGVTQERDMPILWGNGRLLRAMAEHLRRTGDPALRQAAIALGDYVIATRPYYGKPENFEAVGGTFASGFTTCYPSLIDGLVQLGISTGEQRFFDEARFIAKLSLADADFEKRHSHGRLTAYRGMLELDLATGTRDFVDTVEAGVSQITERYPFPTGGIPEIFDVAYDRDEGCSEADWVWVHLLLWQATRNPRYLDVAENVVRNHIYATQFANGGFGHARFETLALNGTPVRGASIQNVASDSYWCCSMHVAQLLADLPSWGVVVDGNTIRVTLLAEVHATVRMNDTPVNVSVEEPEPGSWTITVAPETPLPGDVAVRLPGWAAAMRVDGEEHAGHDGWVVVSRAWEGGSAVAVELPRALRVVPVDAGAPGAAVVYSGADMLCLPEFGLVPAFERSGQVPQVTLCPDRLVDAHLPALVGDTEGTFQQVVLGPTSQRLPGGCRYVFDVRAVDAPEFDPLWLAAVPPPDLGVPLRIQAASASPYVVYVSGARVFEGNGTEESPTVEVKTHAGDQFVAIAVNGAADPAGLIASIRYGDGRLVTQTAGWRAYAFDHLPSAEEATATALAPRESLPIRDLGEFGIPPWEHVPGHFASIGAHWIWAEAGETAAAEWWVFAIPFAIEDAS